MADELAELRKQVRGCIQYVYCILTDCVREWQIALGKPASTKKGVVHAVATPIKGETGKGKKDGVKIQKK